MIPTFTLGALTNPGAGGGVVLIPAEPYEGQVATRSFVASNSTPAQTQSMCRAFHFARDDITSLKLVFQDATGVNEAVSGATTTIEASIEYPEGVYTRVQFSGVDAGSMASGATLISDATAVTIPNGAKFFTRVYRLNANGFRYNLYATRNDVGGDKAEAGTSVTNRVMGGTITSNVNFTVTPQAIIGQTRRVSVFMVGDSRCIGVNDDFTDNTNGDTGEFARTLGPEFAYINAGIAGDSPSTFLTSPTKRLQLASYCSHVVSNYGINQLTAGGAASVVQSTLLVLWGRLRNDKDGLFHSTLPPVTTSTDGWATLANQTTVASNAARQTVNTFIRTTPDNLDAFFEHAAAVEAASAPGKWEVGMTTEGTHESEAAYVKEFTDGVIDTALFIRPDYDPTADEADLLFTQWETPPSGGVESAYRTYIAALKTAGIWAKLDVLYVLAAPDQQAARINLIHPKRFRLSRYNAPAFAAFDGFKSAGAGSDLSTNWQPSRDAVNFTLNNASLFVWSNDNVTASTVICGHASSGAKTYIGVGNAGGGTMGHTLNTSSLTNAFIPAAANGLFTLSRNSSANYVVYRNATALGTQVTASTTLTTSPLRICSGTGFEDTTRAASIFGAGAYLDATEVTALHTATNALLVALGAI